MLSHYSTKTFRGPSSVQIILLSLWLSVLQSAVWHVCLYSRKSTKHCSSCCNEMSHEIDRPPGQKWLPLTFFFSGPDPTRITQGPADMEIIVGESIVLPCQVASDPVLDVSFSWAFNGQLIAKGDGHFELVGGVSDQQSSFFRTCEWAVGTSFPFCFTSSPLLVKSDSLCLDIVVSLREIYGG